MADYGKLFSRIWSDPDFTAMDARPQQLYALLVSFPTRNPAGVLPVTLKRWVKATRDATIENVTDAVKTLTANCFTVIDWDTEEILVRTFIRNDEVYRQPNLMLSALKFARLVESETLRWALHDELTRLPDHKHTAKALETAESLVDGLIRTPSEPIGEPLAEPIAQGSGVGEGYVGKGEHLHRTPKPSPTPEAAPIGEPIDGACDPIAATSGAELIARIVPREHPPAVKTRLRIAASELINTGTPAADVAAALELWLTKPHLGPNMLPSLVSEVIRSRAAPPNGKPHKLRAFAELAAEVRATEQAELESTTARKALE